MKKYDNREEMKRILLAGNLNSNNDDSWNVRHILDGATLTLLSMATKSTLVFLSCACAMRAVNMSASG